VALKTPVIAIVGRPNVGKSTLFNRILGEKKAVVEDLPGVTRDRNYGLVERYEFPFILVDTGGFESKPEEEMIELVADQTRAAIEESDVVLALFDGQSGLHPGDHEIVSLLRQYDKPVVYIVNKCDGKEQSVTVSEFYELGLETIENLSALHGRGVKNTIQLGLCVLPNYEALVISQKARLEKEKQISEEAMEKHAEFVAALQVANSQATEVIEASQYEQVDDRNEPEEQHFAPVFVPSESGENERDYEKSHSVKMPDPSHVKFDLTEQQLSSIPEVVYPELTSIKLAIVGRPNVGKSTLLNTITGEHRAITSDEAGTTRDTVDVIIQRDGMRYHLVDTAGLRKKAKVNDAVERYSTLRSIKAISECDVALVLIDAERGPSEQDAKILGLAHEHGKGIVLVINKWDKVEKDHRTVKKYQQEMREEFKFVPYAPVLFVSALSGKRCPKVIEAARAVAIERGKRITTSHLNRVLQKAVKKKTPAMYRGQQVKLYFAAQVGEAPPRIALYFNHPKEVHFSYSRYLKNTIRKQYGFEGTDIKFSMRRKGRRDSI
jgi:GTP-binding protein